MPARRHPVKTDEELHADVERVLLTREEIRVRVAQLGSEISAAYADRPLTVVGILTGAFVFTADLVRELEPAVEVVFAKASSYGGGSRPGNLALQVIGAARLTGKDVLVVEDILDTGRSLLGIREAVRRKSPRTLRSVVLLDKRERREVEVEADFVGFRVPDEFLVGYGLDYAERYRHLPYVAVLRRTVYEGDR